MNATPTQSELPSLIESGLSMVDERLAASPGFGLYTSIKNQLEYMKQTVHAGLRPTEGKIDSLTLGIYAAREFETPDPDFASVLFDVEYLFKRFEGTETTPNSATGTPAPQPGLKNEVAELLKKQLAHMEVRRAVLADLFLAVASLILVLYFFKGDSATTRVVVLAFGIAACFVVASLWLLYRVATSGAWRARLLTVLEHEPESVARIYGAVLIRTGRSAFLSPIKAPEAENLDRPGGYNLVIVLKEPGRARRLLGLNKYVVAIAREQLASVLASLRSLAPGAAGPP